MSVRVRGECVCARARVLTVGEHRQQTHPERPDVGLFETVQLGGLPLTPARMCVNVCMCVCEYVSMCICVYVCACV